MTRALYFGSFNPVHYGHTSIAEYVASMPGIDAVMIIPSPHNPCKDKSTLAPAAERLQACKDAFSGISPRISVCDIECRLSEPLYTIRTLRELAKEYPDDDLVLVMGADNISGIEKWYDWKSILAGFRILVYPREGYDGEKACRKYAAELPCKGITFMKDAPLYDISSTAIRKSSGSETTR